MEQRAQFTLRGLIVITLLIAVIVALVVPSFVRAMRRASRGTCSSSLRSLWQSQFNYAAQYGRPNGDMPDETGVAFWLKLQRTPKPLIDRYELFTCPESDDVPGPGRCSYRGPAFPIRTMSPEDPLAADKEGNHGRGQGGNILRKTGDVGSYEETDPLWIRARTTTKE